MIDQSLLSPPFARLSIVFPMWNEEEYIARAVRAAVDVCLVLQERGDILDFEIVVVDDASTDGTPAVADDLAGRDARIRVVHHDVNRKLGGSIRSGFRASTGDAVLYTDADLPFDMTELVRAVRLLRMYEADMVCAYRLDRTGEGPRRALYSWIYNTLVQVVLDTKVRDVNFAFKLMRREVLDKVQLVSEGSFIDAELVARAKGSGFTILQIGVDYFPRTRGVSTLSSWPVIRRMLAEMGGLRRELRSLNRPPA